MWVIIKRQSDVRTDEPICRKFDDLDTAKQVVKHISDAMSHNELVQVGENYWVHPSDILSVRIYDENEYVEETHANMKSSRRRLNEG